MRKLLSMFAVAALCAAFVQIRAAEEKTIKGESECTKCTLKETPKCGEAVTVEEGGKKVVYYLTANKTAKGMHKKAFCSGGKTVAVTGDVKEKDGKMTITASKIKVVEE